MNGSHPAPERLDAYLLDELDGMSRRDVGAHLEACPACREQVVSLQQALAAYRGVEPAVAIEAGLDRLLTAQLAHRASESVRAPRRALILSAAAVAVLIFLSGYWTGRRVVIDSAAVSDPVRTSASERMIQRIADHDPPKITFAVAEGDRLGAVALRDTTWN